MSRIEELEKRLAADPNSRMFVQLAEEYRKQGLLENAIEICEQGLTKHPQYPSARVALGRALLEAEIFERARDEFEAVLAQVPDNILANKLLGETYHRLGRYDEAIQKYQIAQTLAPEDAELEGKIEAVKAEKAEGGPPPPRAAPAPAGPTASAPPAPAPVATGDAPLEATLVDAPAAAPEVSQAPPPVPAKPDMPPAPSPPAMPEAAAATEAPASAEEEPLPAPDESAELAPIPLVDVDGPMVLESPAESYARVGEPAADATPDEPVPVVSPTEPPPMEPAPMEPAPTEPPPMEPAPMESPPMEPAAFEPPPLESPEAVPVPVPVPVPVEEPLPVEPLPVEPLPVEPVAAREHAAEPPHSSDDIETPTMAELYASQGHFDKAVLVYRNLLTRDPNETQYLERIEELEMLANATADSNKAAPAATGEARGDGLSVSKRQQTIEVLERWLEDIRRSRGA